MRQKKGFFPNLLKKRSSGRKAPISSKGGKGGSVKVSSRGDEEQGRKKGLSRRRNLEKKKTPAVHRGQGTVRSTPVKKKNWLPVRKDLSPKKSLKRLKNREAWGKDNASERPALGKRASLAKIEP